MLRSLCGQATFLAHVALAARHTILTMYFSREFTAAGGLLSYGASLIDATRQGGIYTGKNPERRQTRRSAGVAADQVRARDQP